MKKILMFTVGMISFLFILASLVHATPGEITSCTTITQAGTYYLTTDILNSGTSHCMSISANNVTLDCQGHNIDGTDTSATYGIYIYRTVATNTNIKVKNCNITDWYCGVYTYYAKNNTLTNNTANSNYYGFRLRSSSYNTLTNNTANSNTNYGFFLDSSSNNNITSNTANSNNYYGFYLTGSSGNTLTNNTISVTKTAEAKQQGLHIYGLSISKFRNNISTSNTINGLAIDYYDGIDRACPNNTALDLGSSYSFIGLVGCNNVSVTASNNLDHVLLVYTTNSIVYNINASFSRYGFYLDSSSNNNITSNTANSNYYYGFYLDSSSGNTLTNNTANSNTNYGFYLDSSSNNNITSNTANSNYYYGFYLSLSSNNNITSNTISDNTRDLYDDGNNIYSSNKFLNNLINRMITVSIPSQMANTNDLIKFNISVFFPNGTTCSDFTYNTYTRPNETVNTSTDGNNIIGNFTVTRLGFYSLVINITDNENNVVKRNYIVLVNSTSAKLANYYFRGVNPTHGQPASSDAKSLLLTPPTTQESWTCIQWIEASPDDLTVSTPNIIKNLNISTWYKVGYTDSYMGVEKDVIYDSSVDYSQIVPEATTYTWINLNFSLEWPMEYPRAWYYLAIKLVIGSSGNHGDPYLMTNATDPGYVNITYNYTTTPEIKNNTNTDIMILAATSPADNTNKANITLDGVGSTNLTVQMPNTDLTYSTYLDDVLCDSGNADCNVTQSNGELNLSLSLDSEHEVYIFFSDTEKPTYSNNQTNTKVAGQPCNFTLEWDDNVGLSGYIFSTNNSGSWQNASFANFSGTSNTSWNVTTLNSTVGALVQWKFYTNDTSNNWNVSEIYNLTTTRRTTTTTTTTPGGGGGGGGRTTTTSTSSTTTTIPRKLGRKIHSVVHEIVKRTVSEIKDLIENKELKQGLRLAIGKEISEAVKGLVSSNTIRIQDKIEVNRTLIIDQDLNESSLSLRLNYNGNKKIKDFMVYDKIPKSFANSSDSITVTVDAKVFVVKKDPEYLISYTILDPDEEKIVIYSVDGRVDENCINDTSAPIVFAGSLETLRGPLALTTIVIAITVIIGIVLWKIISHRRHKEFDIDTKFEKLKEK